MSVEVFCVQMLFSEWSVLGFLKVLMTPLLEKVLFTLLVTAITFLLASQSEKRGQHLIVNWRGLALSFIKVVSATHCQKLSETLHCMMFIFSGMLQTFDLVFTQSKSTSRNKITLWPFLRPCFDQAQPLQANRWNKLIQYIFTCNCMWNLLYFCFKLRPVVSPSQEVWMRMGHRNILTGNMYWCLVCLMKTRVGRDQHQSSIQLMAILMERYQVLFRLMWN